MKHSSKLALLSYIPNFCSSFLYLYLSATFDYNFPFLFVIPSMLITFTASAILIKCLAIPIDKAVEEFHSEKKVSDERIKKFKKAQYRLTHLIPIFFISIMILFILLVNLLYGRKISYFFTSKFILEVSHLIGIFSISFLAQTAIFIYNITPLRKLFNITNLENDKLLSLSKYIFLLCLSFILTVGATLLYYYEGMIASVLYSKSYVHDFNSYFSASSSDEQLKYLAHIVNEKIKDHENSIVIQKEYLKKLENSTEMSFDINLVRLDDTSILFTDPFHMRAVNTLKKHQNFFTLFLVFLIIYAYVIIYLFGKIANTQTNSIRLNIDEIVDNDKQVKPLVISDITDISLLTNSFNKLLKYLESKNIKLKELNMELEEKVDERTKELNDAMLEMQHIALTDELTKLKNRKYFDICLSRELKKASNNGKLSLIYLDLDYFKKVNDNFGHLLGDNVLVNTAKLMKERLRGKDIAARWGGEEFIIILPETNIDGAMALAEQLRQAMENFEHPDVGVVTGSFGCTSCLENDDEDSILRRCDKALYTSKSRGRNCVSKR